jgi:hypothetical protein
MTGSTGQVHDTFPPGGVVFLFDGEAVSYTDLAVVTMLCDEWRPFVDASTRGVYAVSAEEVDRPRLRAASERFRRARGLEAAEDLGGWLEARGLTSTAWREALERSLTATEGGRATTGPDEGPAPSVLNADAFCTGLWERAADRAVNWLAASTIEFLARPAAPGGDILSAAGEVGVGAARLEVISRWFAAFEKVRTDVASDDAVARLVRTHELDWTTVEFGEMSFVRRPEACEALLCCRDDGLKPEQVIARSGGRLSMRAARIDALPAPVAAECLATDVEGRTVGPFETADGWNVLHVSTRVRPDPTDPDIRRAAVAELLENALAGETAGRIRWIGPV